MRDVRRLVILDWLLTGTGERWTDERRPPVRGGPGPGQGDPGEPADRAARGAAPRDPGMPTAPPAPRRRARWPRTPRTTGCWSAWTRVRPGRPGRRGSGRRVRQPGRPGVRQPPTRRIPASSRPRPRSPSATCRRCTRTWSGPSPTPTGRVRLEGDVATVRRVANALRRGLRGGDALPVRRRPVRSVGPRSSSAPRPARASAAGSGHRRAGAGAGSTRCSPPYGLRDEVADLSSSAWAALRTAGLVPARRLRSPPPRPGRRGRKWSCGPSRCRPRPTGKGGHVRAEELFGIHVNPYLTAAGVAELAADIQQAGRHARGRRQPPSSRRSSTPTSSSA